MGGSKCVLQQVGSRGGSLLEEEARVGGFLTFGELSSFPGERMFCIKLPGFPPSGWVLVGGWGTKLEGW